MEYDVRVKEIPLANSQCERLISYTCYNNYYHFIDRIQGPECRPNEVYANCGAGCPATCENGGRPQQCNTLPCISGCVCAHGLVRRYDGGCVAIGQCNTIILIA